ncbi:hypothetical protein CIB95_01975 [Lottiidibacillus patelloidae]|uniref:Uncharacterized protein n=1 Tax=Lottiidibacillus patelloidae TaxID=2670334 RepID=A0A263BXR4_9BACI|nr:hypothetical protein [Lottiidibacillus patelloidae]OZM58362.1 hypothetical protein CIB95_01975 [Lottiidibacillus patelloidae]
MLVQEERLTRHIAYKNTENVLELIEDIDSIKLPESQLEIFYRVRDIFNYLKHTLDIADPWLISDNTLNNLGNNTSTCLSEINHFKGNRNQQHLNNIKNSMEVILQLISQLVVTRTPDEIEGVRNSVIRFRQSAAQHLSNLEKEVTESKSTFIKNKKLLIELSESINSQKQRIDTIISDFQDKFLNGQSERNEKTEQLIKNTKEELNNSFHDFEEKLANQILVQKELFEDQLQNQKSVFEDAVAKLNKKMQDEYNSINEMNKEAEKILGLMSMKGLAHGYQKIANTEARKAFTWNLFSIATLVFLLSFGVKFIINSASELNWTVLVSRFIITGIGLTLFTYCAKQAGNHRNEERKNRKIELELASLDPYLKDLDTEKQKDVKESLVNKYFGVGVSLTNVDEQSQNQKKVIEDLISNPELIKSLADQINKLRTEK